MLGLLRGASTRRQAVRLIALGGLITVLLAFYTYCSGYIFEFEFDENKLYTNELATTCTPQAYSRGKWVHRTLNTPKRNMTAMDDVLDFAGYKGCASDREYYWHLGADNKPTWDRFPGATEWEWQPGPGCERMRPLEPTEIMRDMVEQGGWLLIGDSVTENHFFSLSCLLYPHVRATPNYTENPYFDRAWPQNLYLKSTSPLISSLRLPADFSIEETPLVTFRRVDFLLDKEELEGLYDKVHPRAVKPLFGEDQFWSLSPSFYMDLFLGPLPQGGYSTLVVSTGGHWTTTSMPAFREEDKPKELYGIQGVLDFFDVAMHSWARYVQGRMDAFFVDSARGTGTARRRNKHVVVRAYLPGHDGCHNYRAPWTRIEPMIWKWYNWFSIKDFNRIFERIVNTLDYPDIDYLPIERPARLRPDAHVASDCLHIMTGAGVLEGWTHYIWQYVTRELPGLTR